MSSKHWYTDPKGRKSFGTDEDERKDKLNYWKGELKIFIWFIIIFFIIGVIDLIVG